MAVQVVDQVAPIGPSQTVDKIVECLQTRVSQGIEILRSVVVQQVLSEVLSLHVRCLRVCDQLFYLTLEVGLIETAAQCAQPTDQIVSFDMSAILDVDELKERLSRVL